MGRPWEQALDLRTEIYEWWDSPTGKQYETGFMRSVHAKMSALEVAMYADMTSRYRYALRDADPIYITPDMMTLIEAASKSIQIEMIHDHDLISLNGLVLLPRPVQILDINEKWVSFRAVHWWPITYQMGPGGPSHRGLQIAFYHYTRDQDDYWTATEKHWANWILNFSIPWFFDTTGSDDDHDVFTSLTGKFLLTLWRLMQQRIAIRTSERATSPFRARAARAQLEEKHVVLVTLRRPTVHRTDGEPREVEWTHQWLVSGHWRMQPYGDGTVKQIWINPYVKGPQHLPLAVPTTKVYTLVR
jgi:hypothetical protein